MSKSLGNVLDPFEIIEQFGTDALRFYCLREVSFGQDGSVSTAGFEARYETELANDSATSPAARSRWSRATATARCPPSSSTPTLAAELRRPRRRGRRAARPRRADAALEAIWQRVRRLNRYVEEQAPWQLAKDAAHAGRARRVLASLAEGLRVVDRAAAPVHAGSDRRSCSPRSARPSSTTPARARGAGRAARRAARAAVPQARRQRDDRLPHPPGRAASRPTRSSSRAARRRACADAHGRHRRRALPRGARRRRALPAGLRRDRPPPQRGDRLRRRRPRRAARRSPRTRAASRSARPASTSTATTRRATTRSARSRRRSSSRARPASRS